MTIIIDTAEKELGKQVAEWLTKWKVPYIWKDISVNTNDGYEKVGDYTTDKDMFLVEAKLDEDYYSSVLTSRIDTQAEKISRISGNPFIAIIGYLSEIIHEHPEQKNWLLTTRARLECQWGVNVKVFEDVEQFTRWLWDMERYSGTAPRPVMERKKLTVPTPQKMLMQIPGIREELSLRLLKKFKTLNGVMNASIDALMKVEGVADKKAENIHKACREMVKSGK